MKRITRVLCAALAMAAFAISQPATVSAEDVQSLRGDTGLTKTPKAPRIFKLDVSQDKIPRNFKQQPALVPHKVAKYRINMKVNRCLSCHDKATYKKEEAPMAGKSHYLGADGKEQKKISMRRYFCNQCHVPQMDAKPLVRNSFRASK